ncbi:MAG: DUF4391 domain-containing protein [Oscillospiraceae bacterium]|nr:DUF4391 domain-containing protein [Oscillospiraceae bacterium]
MISLPESTRLHRRMPKEAFYGNLQLSPAVKSAFVNDLERIYIEYGLSKENLHLPLDSDVEVIYLMMLELKKMEYDPRILEAIARQNPHRLIFLLVYEDQVRLAIYQGKLHTSDWLLESELKLTADGQSMREIWDSFVEQIALKEEQPGAQSGLSVEERLKRQERIRKLEQSIEKTEAVAWKEKQPHKRFELHQRVQKLKQELEDLKNG